ncbi:protein phosphatase 1 regulatory subunit 42 [Calliopsis andreniformis]|uniref:protein phosphatase 1 regulatory subunit 42 n=1 Tax=Calliopsis andreniformis TaxID=337506 RepID=UPI003FCE4090
MVTLTTDYIEKRSQSRLSKFPSAKTKKTELYGLTHLRMNNMYINSIGNIAVYKNLKVIYLQNNNISRIDNLQFASNLTHLYLQHNAINKLENLDCFTKLETLYLGYNDIAVVEGLEHLRNLTVLHVERQRLTHGESLCFDPRSMHALSNCLKVFNISGNKLSTLRDIKSLEKLEVLDTRNNRIDDINDLTEIISALTSLRELSIQDNPITEHYRYRENLIANNDTLRMLNGVMVTDICRCFMKRFKIEKHRRTKQFSKVRLDEDITSSLNLPLALKKSISRAMNLQHPTPKVSISVSSIIDETQPQIFLAWKTAPGIEAMRHGHITPRLFWNHVAKTKHSYIARSSTKSKSNKLSKEQVNISKNNLCDT